MRPLVDWVEARATSDGLRKFASMSDFRSACPLNWHPELIVVLEAHPDEYARGDVELLVASNPVSRIVCCAGAWSESAGRTRSVWPLAMRVAVVHAVARLEREWRLVTNQSCVPPLPATGNREEWFAAHHPPLATGDCDAAITVGVLSPDPSYRQMLVDLVQTGGFRVAQYPDQPVDVVLWDVDPLGDKRPVRGPDVPASVRLIALTGWLISDVEAELLRAGVQAVHPKLGDANRLLAALCRKTAAWEDATTVGTPKEQQ
jgi:hypothetical protein